jgi:polyisoprenoid-binding protein YceI
MARYVFDHDHTAASFAVRHMMVTWVHGHFSKVTGALDFDPQSVHALSVDVEIDTSSIYTGVAKRDADLMSPNYFDTEKHPKITFKSKSAECVALDRCLVHGDLTIHGITKPVTLDVAFAGPSRFQDEDKMYTTYGFQAKTRVNREDFGMKANLGIENGGFMVGKHAYLTINVEGRPGTGIIPFPS